MYKDNATKNYLDEGLDNILLTLPERIYNPQIREEMVGGTFL